MRLPAIEQPDVETIAAELEAWQRRIASGGKEDPLKELPLQNGEPSSAAFICGLAVRIPLLALGSLARKARLPLLRQWAAHQQIRLDWMTLCRASCSLNHAWTELGLALLERGDVPMAIDCLERSWHVHPCPHDTSHGLSPCLWKALDGTPQAEEARIEYENMARRFASGFGLPRNRVPLLAFLRAVIRAEWHGD